MTVPENQPKNQDGTGSDLIAPVFGHQWPEVLKDPAFAILDRWRLLPVSGKKPLINAWPGLNLNRAACLAQQIQGENTGFGIITGPQWPGPSSKNAGPETPRPDGADSLICFDFDGESAWQFVQAAGLNLKATPTFRIVRVGPDGSGHPRSDRFKLVFRTTPDQAEQLGTWFIEKQHTGTDDNGNDEALEVFHTRGKQIVALGHYPIDDNNPTGAGFYMWQHGWTPNNIAELPQKWFDLALDIHQRNEERRRAEPTDSLASSFAKSDGSEWRRLASKEPCPICGRTAHGGSPHICAEHKTSGTIRCYRGTTFSYDKLPGWPLKIGSTIRGSNGTTYFFASEREDGPDGSSRANFPIHKEREETLSLPPQPLPWEVDTPASEQTVEATTAEQVPDGISKDQLTARAKALVDDVSGLEARIDTSCPEGIELLTERLVILLRDLGRFEVRTGSSAVTTTVIKLLEQPPADGGQQILGRAADGAFMLQQPAQKLVKEGRVSESNLIYAEKRERELTAGAIKLQRMVDALPADLSTLEKENTSKPLLAELGPLNTADKVAANAELVAWVQRMAANRPKVLRYNTMLSATEFIPADGPALEISDAAMKLLYMGAAELGVECRQRSIIDAVTYVAHQDTYHPVVEYMNVLRADDSVQPFDLDKAAAAFTGSNDPLDAVLWRKWLIAAAARVLRPGCKADGTLVIQGEQGSLKSTLFRTLAVNPKWFVDTPMSSTSEKDILLQFGRCWIFEAAELDSVTTKKDAGTMKALLSSQVDRFRSPYGELIQDNPRRSITCGTCNTGDFLRDETGSRRFWVVALPNGQHCNVAAAQHHLDGIWKAAFHAAMHADNSLAWNLTSEQEQQLQQRNAGFEPELPMAETITNWLRSVGQDQVFTATTALVNSSSVTRLTEVDRQRLQQAGKVLRDLGWVKASVKVDGRPASVFAHKDRPSGIAAKLVRQLQPEPYNGQRRLGDEDSRHWG